MTGMRPPGRLGCWVGGRRRGRHGPLFEDSVVAMSADPSPVAGNVRSERTLGWVLGGAAAALAVALWAGLPKPRPGPVDDACGNTGASLASGTVQGRNERGGTRLSLHIGGRITLEPLDDDESPFLSHRQGHEVA